MKCVPARLTAAIGAVGLTACAATASGGGTPLSAPATGGSAGTAASATASLGTASTLSPGTTNQSSPGTQVACDMLMRNPVIGQLANTNAPLRVLAKAETSPHIYECQVGLRLTTTFTHGAEGGILCHYGDPKNLVAAGKPLASNVYRTALPRTFVIIVGPHTAAELTVFLPGPPKLRLVAGAAARVTGGFRPSVRTYARGRSRPCVRSEPTSWDVSPTSRWPRTGRTRPATTQRS